MMLPMPRRRFRLLLCHTLLFRVFATLSLCMPALDFSLATPITPYADARCMMLYA